MANSPRISAAAANAAANAVVDLLDAGSPPGFLKIYTGSQPAKPEDSIGGATLLATLTLSSTAFSNATATDSTAGICNAATISSDSSADTTGTAAWFRLSNQAGTGVIDGSVGTSGCDLNLNTVNIQQSANVSCSSFTYTQQKGW